MAIVLNPTAGLRDVTQFPVKPGSGAAARNQIQSVIDQVVNQTNSELTAKASVAQPGWSVATLLNGTQNQDSSTYNGVAYRKDTIGVVRFKGVITVPATNTIICNLPAGYRPLKVHYCIVSAGTGGTFSPGSVTIYPNGDVKYTNGALGYIDLTQIIFDAEQ